MNDPHETMYNVPDPAYIEWTEKLRAEAEKEQERKDEQSTNRSN